MHFHAIALLLLSCGFVLSAPLPNPPADEVLVEAVEAARGEFQTAESEVQRKIPSGHAEQKALIAKQRQQRGRQGSHQSSSDVLAKLKLSEAAKKQVRAKAETVRKAEEERYVRPQQIQDRNRGRQPLSAFGITDESRGQIPGSPSNPPRRDH